jgi:hypothetical protein
MPSTYEKIEAKTLGSATSSVSFTSIPATYTDLVLVTGVQASTSGQGLTMQLNGDTSSLYSNTALRGNGSAVVSFRQSNNTNTLLSNIAEPPTGSQGVYIAQFLNYSNTTTFKTALVRSNSAGFGVETFVDLYRSTAAISSIKIDISGGNMSIGSTFTLYGIKAA